MVGSEFNHGGGRLMGDVGLLERVCISSIWNIGIGNVATGIDLGKFFFSFDFYLGEILTYIFYKTFFLMDIYLL